MKVVLFDLDDTLFAHAAAVDAGVTKFVHGLRWTPRPGLIQRWRDLEDLHYHRYLTGEIDYLGQRTHRALDLASDYGVTLDDPLAWFDDYLVEYRNAWAIHDDTIACLDALPNARFGIITNGELPFQLAKISSIGILDRFEHIVASGELGITKPDARIFEHAVSLFGVSPADTAYVGDRFETDALGASRAGLTGVWIDRLDIATPTQVAEAAASGVHIVRGLSAVPALLA